MFTELLVVHKTIWLSLTMLLATNLLVLLVSLGKFTLKCGEYVAKATDDWNFTKDEER